MSRERRERMLAGALMAQSALSVIHVGGDTTVEASLSLKRGLLLMEVDKDHEVYKLIEDRVHHSFIRNTAHKLIPGILYEEFATTEIVMES
jgi:hypothetical protein